MPIYEYFCEYCNHTFDLLQEIGSDRINKCPKCNKMAKRLISRLGALQFNGSGFYINDYKNKVEN